MQIYNEAGRVLADVLVEDSSYRLREIKGRDEITLYFSVPVPLELPIGCYVEYGGIRYTMEEPPILTKRSPREIEYNVLFNAPQGRLSRYRFRNSVDGRLKFCLTGKPHEHLEMLVSNLNLREPGWTAGECVEDVERLVSYDYSTCMEALDLMATAFDTEWEVRDRSISLRRVEYFKDRPLPLSYGRGNGFVSGVGRSNREDEDSGLEILYAMGGERNVDPSQNTGGERAGSGRPSLIHPNVVNPPVQAYPWESPMPMSAMPAAEGSLSSAVSSAVAAPASPAVSSVAAPVPASATPSAGVASGNTSLILPRGQELEYEGVTYATDAQGYYVYRKDKPLTSRKEGVLDCSEIYPKRVGGISSVIVVDKAKNLYDFVDDTIPADLDYAECQIDDEKMTVIFQDGMLAGKEFEVNYKHAERRFEIVAQEIDGVMMPNEVFSPAVGGKYAVFNVRMPDAYVCDNASRTGASWDMFRKAAEYLHAHADYQFTFSGTLDGIWAKQNWAYIKDRLVLGGTILFSDVQFQPEGVPIRIVCLKEYLNDPHRPEIELSDETVGQSFPGRIAELENRAVEQDEAVRSQRQYTKRTFRDAKSTMQALNDALDSFKGEFTEGISPITVNTMQLLVGSEQCQFEFVAGSNSTTVVNHDAYYNDSTKKFECAAGFVRYSYVSPTMSHTMSSDTTVKIAPVGAFTSDTLDPDKPYYVYIKVNPSTTESATFLMSETAQAYGQGAYLYLLLGILDKEMFLNRTWSPMYGYTEITPGRIRVNKIISADGGTYFDLQNNEIGGTINFVDGLVSGVIGVGKNKDHITAGMYQTSGEKIPCIWAGADLRHSWDAPFQVYANGNTVIGGNSTFYGAIKPNIIHINRYNFEEYFIQERDDKEWRFIFDKIIGLKTIIYIDYMPDDDLDYWNNIPGLYPIDEYQKDYILNPSNMTLEKLYGYLGSTLRIVNNGNKGIAITGSVFYNMKYPFSYQSQTILIGHEIVIECVCGKNNSGNMGIGWFCKYYGKIVG